MFLNSGLGYLWAKNYRTEIIPTYYVGRYLRQIWGGIFRYMKGTRRYSIRYGTSIYLPVLWASPMGNFPLASTSSFLQDTLRLPPSISPSQGDPPTGDTFTPPLISSTLGESPRIIFSSSDTSSTGTGGTFSSVVECGRFILDRLVLFFLTTFSATWASFLWADAMCKLRLFHVENSESQWEQLRTFLPREK